MTVFVIKLLSVPETLTNEVLIFPDEETKFVATVVTLAFRFPDALIKLKLTFPEAPVIEALILLETLSSD